MLGFSLVNSEHIGDKSYEARTRLGGFQDVEVIAVHTVAVTLMLRPSC